jgi:membrane-bound inhibitor of C-type lysozyme
MIADAPELSLVTGAHSDTVAGVVTQAMGARYKACMYKSWSLGWQDIFIMSEAV